MDAHVAPQTCWGLGSLASLGTDDILMAIIGAILGRARKKTPRSPPTRSR